jgi:hypothetical protein
LSRIDPAVKRLLLLCLALLALSPSAARKPVNSAPSVSIADVTCAENVGNCTVTISKALSKSYSIVSVQTVDGTAQAGSDYTAVSQSITLGSTTTSQTFSVPIINDAVFEPVETFTIVMKSVRNASVVRSQATVTITDDDPTPIVNPPSNNQIQAPIADNFDTSLGLEPAPGGIAGPSFDDVGAFRMLCNAGKLIRDDPVVYPGQPGVSHLHVVWGNQGMDAYSTYSSLRTTGTTTCGNGTYPVNRTAYWMPAMLDGAGNVVLPDLIQNYYKQQPAGSTTCLFRASQCVPLPNGIKYVYGWNPTTMTGGINDPNSMDYWASKIVCWTDYQGDVAVAGVFHSIAAAVQAGCPSGAILNIIFAGPDCWDGIHLDVPDHRSHLAYGTPESGGQKCPTDHPYAIAAWQGQVFFTTDANFVAGKWHLSSDEMVPGFVVGPNSPVPAGSTLHFDYEEAWSPTVKQTWQANCIDRHATCSSGDLGNGTRIKNAESPAFPPHRLVPVP